VHDGAVNLDGCVHLLDQQSGVVSRAQALSCGAAQHDIERWLRRREIATILPGVYVNHTGEPTWTQRAWAAVLSAEPAALGWTSAIRISDPSAGPTRSRDPVHLIVGPGRHPVLPDWVVVHRCDAIEARTIWTARPPRQRLEEAMLDVAMDYVRQGAPDAHLHAVATLADPIQACRTTADRVLTALAARGRATERALIAAVLADLRDGATSVLEHGYVRLVERPHGLPRATRQARQDTLSGTVRRDALYLGRRIIELDGREFHQGAERRNVDLERDLDAAVMRLGSVRLGWSQVFDRPCVTAGKVGRLLATDGWTGALTACGPACVALTVFRAAA
jgi:hypothetical protein